MDGYCEPLVPVGDVPRRLREELERARRAHYHFDDCWGGAVAASLGGVRDHVERRKWVKALEWTRPRWEAAFNLEEPTQQELALVMVGEERGVRVDRPCKVCGEEIPLQRGARGRGAVYCSDVCRSRASNERRVA